jgi:hypothetical protein
MELPHELDPKEHYFPPPPGQRCLVEATVARTMVSSPAPTAGEVDRLYCQLKEIHAIGAMQLAEHAH